MTRITRKELQYLQESQKRLAGVGVQIDETILNTLQAVGTLGMFGGDEADVEDALDDIVDEIENMQDASEDLLDYVAELLNEMDNDKLREQMSTAGADAYNAIKATLSGEFEKVRAAMGTGGVMDEEDAESSPAALGSAVMAGAMAKVLIELFAE